MSEEQRSITRFTDGGNRNDTNQRVRTRLVSFSGRLFRLSEGGD